MPYPNQETQFKTGLQQVEIARKGGSQSTPAKKIAAQLRELKKKGLTDDTAKKIADMMEYPELSAVDILMYILSIKKECHNPYQMNAVANSLINWHKIHHGEKQKIEATHHIIDWAKIINNFRIVEDEPRTDHKDTERKPVVDKQADQ